MKLIQLVIIFSMIGSFFPSEVLANSSPVSALNFSLFQISTEIQEQLKTTKQITSSEIKKLFKDYATVAPITFTHEDNVEITTGSSGTAKNKTARSFYKLDVKPITGYNISIQEGVNLNKEKVIIAVGLTPGSGLVTKSKNQPTMMAKVSDWFDNTVYAQEGTSDVSVVTYYDKNKNGKWDRSEDIVPWAGVTVEMTDANSELKKSGSDIRFFDNIPFFRLQLGGNK